MVPLFPSDFSILKPTLFEVFTVAGAVKATNEFTFNCDAIATPILAMKMLLIPNLIAFLVFQSPQNSATPFCAHSWDSHCIFYDLYPQLHFQ